MADLWWAMLAGSVVLALSVLVPVGLAFLRNRAPGHADPRLWIGGLGLAMPVVVLTLLLVHALRLGAAALPAASDDAMRIRAEASRWRWTFHYPDGRISVNRLDIPAGRSVDIAVGSIDVIHSFWVPRLAGKMDAIPGKTNIFRIEADAPGSYRGECAEYCGIGHAVHGFTVIAHEDAP